MMQIEVTHVTRYTYGDPVHLEPHVLRLKPRSDVFQTVQSFTLEVVPQPVARLEGVDVDGSPFERVWFAGETRELTMVSRATVHTRLASLDEVIPESWARGLPIVYPPGLAARLQPFRSAAPCTAMRRLARDVAQSQGRDTLLFVQELTRHIHQLCSPTVREQGPPLAPQETLARREGTCRDLAVLFIDLCRAEGLAARFVSGYLYPETPPRMATLHAWCEVYIPGAGWRGFDPSLGRPVGPWHVAVATAPRASDAAPVEGSYRGTPTSSLEARVEMTSSAV